MAWQYHTQQLARALTPALQNQPWQVGISAAHLQSWFQVIKDQVKNARSQLEMTHRLCQRLEENQQRSQIISYNFWPLNPINYSKWLCSQHASCADGCQACKLLSKSHARWSCSDMLVEWPACPSLPEAFLAYYWVSHVLGNPLVTGKPELRSAYLQTFLTSWWPLGDMCI